jgi:excisionase family DNA binding protein
MNGLDGWISTAEGARISGYHEAYVRTLAREGTVTAYRIGRTWIVNRENLLRYRREMDTLGNQRHNPWRPELAEEGRGRAH